MGSWPFASSVAEAVVCGAGRIHGIPVAVAVMDFRFCGGAMGGAVGEKITRAIEAALREKIPCVVVSADDSHARLLAQALNHIHWEDDLGLRAELIREVLQVIPEEEVLTILPDTINGLKGMASLGQETVAGYLQNWERARAVRLRNLIFKLTEEQLQSVEKAIEHILPEARRHQGISPNARGTALYLICKSFLDKETKDDS